MATVKEVVKRRLGRISRHARVRKKIKGTAERPRLSVFRSSKHIYAQLIDDTTFKVLAQASTVSSEFKEAHKGYTGNCDAAKVVGRLLAEKAVKSGVKSVVFDKGGFLYHGRVKTLADAAREAGLEF